MRYLALATDYDGTLALHGRVDATTLRALTSLRESGRKLIMVTGRELDELIGILPEIGLFDLVVAENGALLYNPATREEKLLAPKPPKEFAAELTKRGVGPISCGRCIVATWEPHETTCLQTIRDMELELEIIFNKGAVMILPTGVNKATGLVAACKQLGLSTHNVVGVGDAENDHAFLAICECGVAVANALPGLKEKADIVTVADHGAGVTELIGEMIKSDLKPMAQKLTRHHVPLGTRMDGTSLRLPPHGINVMVAGPSGGGKSTATTGLMERLIEGGYQLMVVDPEGDYDHLEGAVSIGSGERAPTPKEILDLLANPKQSVIVNLVAVPLNDRPTFFLSLMAQVSEMRSRTGRPHWVAIDETHHVLPTAWEPAALTLPGEIDRMIFITVHPGEVSPVALSTVDTILAVGRDPVATITELVEAVGEKAPSVAPTTLERGDALYFSRREGGTPTRVRIYPGKSVRRRHVRKYAEGDLGVESFYFRGPEGKLNLQAQNLMLFMQIADGVDDDTWLFHLQQKDYARWFRDAIKDPTLAAEAEEIGRKTEDARETRARIRQAIERRYTAPAAAPLKAA